MNGPPESGRILVTGAAGMLGSQLLRTVPASFTAVGTDLIEPEPGASHATGSDGFAAGVDLTDPDAVHSLFAGRGPFDGVLHPAAYTAVDRAEEDEERARAINAGAAENVARAARAAGVPLVLVSTDFVFDGTKGSPYAVDDPPRPLGVYGRTKLEGEERARTSHRAGASCRVVVGDPTWSATTFSRPRSAASRSMVPGKWAPRGP